MILLHLESWSFFKCLGQNRGHGLVDGVLAFAISSGAFSCNVKVNFFKNNPQRACARGL